MRGTVSFLVVATLVGFLALPNSLRSEDAPTALLLSLEWPPYAGAALPDQGASAKVARLAMERAGLRLAVEFYPWARTVRLARRDRRVAGYFPEYRSKSVEEAFIFTKPIGESPVGFVERANAPVVWFRLEDLSKKRIGVVLGYVNTEEFDNLVAAGGLLVEAAPDDATNIRKVALGRLDMAVIDPNVFRYLVEHQPDLAQYRDRLRINSRLLGVNHLYVCFRRGPEGERLAARFNAGLSGLDPNRIQALYFEKTRP